MGDRGTDGKLDHVKAESARARVITLTEGAKATPVELFLDLVFVYGFTQVTALMAHEGTWLGLAHGVVMLGLLWWLWTGFAWLGNVVQADEGPMRIVLFAVMALVFIIDITIPEAFEDFEGGLFGPWVFAACYLLVQLIHGAAMLYAARRVPRIRRNTLLLLIPYLLGSIILVVAGRQHGWTQATLWAVALAVLFGGVLMIRAEGWQLSAASHFAERHGLIIIIALGESIVSIGVGVTAIPVSWPIIAACVLGIAVCAALWWAYFDVVALVAEDVLHHTAEAERARLARDSYTLLHFPMIVGIIMMSLGLKKVFAHLGDPLEFGGMLVLYGGVSLYLLAHVAFRWRNLHTLNGQRLAVGLLLAALIPVGTLLPALAALVLLTVILVGLVAYEARRFAQVRARIRHGETSIRP